MGRELTSVRDGLCKKNESAAPHRLLLPVNLPQQWPPQRNQPIPLAVTVPCRCLVWTSPTSLLLAILSTTFVGGRASGGVSCGRGVRGDFSALRSARENQKILRGTKYFRRFFFSSNEYSGDRMTCIWHSNIFTTDTAEDVDCVHVCIVC